MMQPNVVIIGGGFGGLYAARALERVAVRVTLVDRRNHHVFQPLLYQVATAALSPGDIASPIRWILRRQPNVEVLLADAERIDAGRRAVVLADGEIGYDYLIIASGATHAYFGRDEWRRFAPGLKTLEDALEIRRRVLLAFERAERETDPRRRQALLTFVVIGGGPTGVELAGALAEISRQSLARDFRHFDPGSARIVLVEAGAALLAAFPPALAEAARRQLMSLGVDVRTGAAVTGISEGRVEIGGESIEAATILWAAGVAASPLGRTLGAPTDRVGRVLIDPDLSVPGHRELFVIGDLASLNGTDGRPLPGVAQVAIQMGRHAARNIERDLSGKARTPFRYRDYGNMATIGRASAVADFGWLRLKGWFAWLAWLFVHIMNLIGFRNRLVVFVQWAWAYFSYQRAVRLITGSPERDKPTS
ncbi:MAG: pyridine nucleotide-disulfide oxidoreductase [Acidobacteria bacterium RIFCSPLOWO2_02_FULL_67_36]|nr:MAG: pyridine nucleotide-disulfide oxidoreductase [Acidobacteria bacterium RIFCSPLOWO2_02_FULL_67_36]OFW25469.1 MAG: pyridine nucleotide-disulfide oxidoreductase [Acidobacteria bacterium RIFCSPLOWO2_12_FULL_66_21]